jgi:hypothetical protein
MRSDVVTSYETFGIIDCFTFTFIWIIVCVNCVVTDLLLISFKLFIYRISDNGRSGARHEGRENVTLV